MELRRRSTQESAHFNLILQIKNQFKKQWDCKLQHQWRESNKYADQLAKCNLMHGLGEEIYHDRPSSSIRNLLAYDFISVTTPKLVQA